MNSLGSDHETTSPPPPEASVSTPEDKCGEEELPAWVVESKKAEQRQHESSPEEDGAESSSDTANPNAVEEVIDAMSSAPVELLDAISAAQSLLGRDLDLSTSEEVSFTTETATLRAENERLKGEVEGLELMLSQAMHLFQEEKRKHDPSRLVEEKGKQFDNFILDSMTLTEGLLFGDDALAKPLKISGGDDGGASGGGDEKNGGGGGSLEGKPKPPSPAQIAAARVEVFKSWFQPKKPVGKNEQTTTQEEVPDE
jgi:hypothetical protein